MMRLEIINPHDQATIDCSNLIAAHIAILLLGEGRYGIKNDENHNNGMPLFIVGGHDEWFIENHGFNVEKALEITPIIEIANALKSIKLSREKTSINGFTERAKQLAKILIEEK